MPTYQLDHELTGRAYKVRFDSDPTPEDMDAALSRFTEEDGFDAPTLAEMDRERTKLTTLQKQAAIFPPLASAADTFMEALPVSGSVKQFISSSTDDPMRAGPSEIRRRLTASQERLANLQRGGRRFLESERQAREDTGQGRFSSAVSAIPQEVLKAPGTAVKGLGDVAGAVVPSWQGNVVSQFGEAMNEVAAEWAPTNPAYASEFQQKAGQAVGQGAASLAEAYLGGGAARAVGAGKQAVTTAATLAPRVTGFLKGASQGEDTARTNQVTDPFARAALVLGTGGIEAATEAIGGVGGKEGTQALMGQGLRPRLNAAGEVIASEAGEEMGAGLAQPLLERATITPDPARPGYSLGGQKLAPIPTSIDDAQAWLRSAQEQGFYGAIGAAVPGAIAGMRSTPSASVTEAPVNPDTAPTTDAGSTPAAGTPSPTPSVPPSAPRQSLADIAAGAGRAPSPPLPVSASPRLPLSPGTYTGADAHTQITSTLATTAQDPDAPQGLRELDAELAQHDYTGITLEVVDDADATVESEGQRLPFTGYASHGTTPGTGTIGVNLARTGRGGASPTDAVRHEALHFRLKREIDQPSTPAAQQALTGLTALRDTLAADPEAAQEFDYETGDLHEWISGIASSKPLRAKLASMPASPAAQSRGIRNMWDQFVAWVKQIVTGKPATQRTALDDALAHILTLTQSTRTATGTTFRTPGTQLLPPDAPEPSRFQMTDDEFAKMATLQIWEDSTTEEAKEAIAQAGLSWSKAYPLARAAADRLMDQIGSLPGVWSNPAADRLDLIRGKMHHLSRLSESYFYANQTPGYSELRDTLTEANLAGELRKDIRPHVLYKGERGFPGVKSFRVLEGEASNISKSEYPDIIATLNNGRQFVKRIRVSDHDQVSDRSPRHYAIDLRISSRKKGERRESYHRRIITEAKERLEDFAEKMWEKHRSIIENAAPLAESDVESSAKLGAAAPTRAGDVRVTDRATEATSNSTETTPQTSPGVNKNSASASVPVSPRTNLLPPGSQSTNLPRDARQPNSPAQTRTADPRAGLRADPQVRISAIRRTVERIAAAHGAEVRWHRRDDPQAKVAHEGKGVILSLSGSFPEVLNTLSPEARRGNLTKLQVKLALENGYRAAGQASPKPRTPATVAKDVMASLVQGYRREEGFAEETRRGFAAALSTLRRKPYAAGDTEVFLKEINQVIRDPKPFLDHLLRQLMELRATGRITEQDDGTFTGEPEWEARTLDQLNRFMVQAAAGTHGDTVQSIIMQSIPALDDSMIAANEGERNLASLPPEPAPSPTLPSREDYLRDWIAREKQILRDQLRDIEARYRAERPNLAASIILRAMSQRFVDRSPENTRFISLRKTRRLHAAKLAQARDELRTLTDPAYAAKVAPHRTPEARAKAAADSWAHVRRTVGYAFGWHTRYLFDPITGQILEIPSAGVIADQIGAIAAEVKDIATFTTRLAQRFGDWITPHARALWNAVKEATRAALMRALEKIGAIKFAVPYQEDAASLGASVPPASVPSAHAIAQGVKFTGQPTPPPFDGAQLVGTCVSEQQINTAFGDMDTFERLVQERGDEFTEGDTTVTYNPRTHEHFFWKHTDPASAPQLLPPSVRYPGRGPFKVENLVAQAQITGSPLPADFREILGRSNEEKAALKNSAARLARDLDAEMRRQVKLTSATRTQLESTVNNALDDPAVMTALAASNPSLHARVLPMRNMLDTLSTTVASWTSQTMGDTILGNLGSWLRRSYMAFDPSSGWSYDALVDAAAKGKAVLGQTPAAVILRNARAFLQAQNPSATPDQITIQMKLLTDRQTWLNVLSGNKDAKVTKDVTSLIRRKEIPAPLRALMGEVRDPLARFGQSASFQAQFIARHEMQQRMRDTGLALGIFSPVQTPDHLVQVGGVDGADANPVWSGFGADLWTTPQMLAALRNAKGVNTGTTLRDRILDTIAFLGGKSKEARVALSPDFYSTNIIGAVLALAGSGDLTLSQQSLRSMGKAMQTLWMARLDKTAVTPAAKQATIDAARDLVSRLESAGVLSSGVNMDELLASLTSPTAEALTNTKTKDRVAGAAQGALTLQGLGHTIAGNPGRLAGAAVGAALGGWAGMKNISKPHRALMEALVSTPDLFAKLTAYLNNRDAYLRSGLSAEDAHAKAVEVTRNTMPDYSKVPAFLRELSRLGIIGSFIAFRAESYRNLYWNARYAAQELRSGNPALRLRGAQRLMGIALSQSLAAGKIAGIFGLLGYLSDADDEEDKAYRRALARKWDANAQLVYDKLDANGASYFSADYLVPQASAMQIIRAAVEGRSFAESMTAVASTIKEQAIGGNLVLQPLIEAYTNSKFEGNFPVSTKQGWEGAFDRALHVLETMEPGYASKAKKLVRAATGMGLGRAEYTFTDEALRTLGLRMNNVKHEPQIRSKLSEFNALLAATRTSANAAWSNFGGRTLAPAGAKMRQDALDAANAERAQIKADFDAWLNDLSTLRISPQKVKSIGSLPSFAPLRVTKDGVTAANLR